MGYFDSFGFDYVASMDNAIEAAEVRTAKPKFEQLPDGKYQMYVNSLEIKESQFDDGYPILLMKLTVVDGEYAGKSAFKRYPLEPNKNRMDALKSDFFLLGVDLKSLRDLENADLMTTMLDKIVEVQIKTKVSSFNGKSYANYYLNRLVGDMKQASSSSFKEVNPNETPWA